MKRILIIVGAALAVILVGAGVYLWTPAPAPFDAEAARSAASAYDVRIIRDEYGVPHIYGERDVDVAFGLAYAHAEDDWATIEETLLFSRGALAQQTGKTGAVTDYLVNALGVTATVNEKYETDLSPETRALLEAYASGVNLWCTEEKARCTTGVAPVTGKDVVAGFVARQPFFYGLDETLTTLFDENADVKEEAEAAREAYLRLHPGVEVGSNAVAVAPSRAADGHTRLLVNSHQPFTGPVAWYEARVRSQEGWDMIGGIFPGTPVILHGAGPDLGWAFTVNKPDLVDVYALKTDKPKNPTAYYFDGGWREFEKETATFRVKLFGPFSLPVRRPVLRSIHGPVFETLNGYLAVAYAGAGDVRAVEQYYLMNKAQTFEDWRTAMAMQALPSLNAVYADREGNIAYYYNAAIPERSPDWDWSKIAPGDRLDLVWKGVLPFGSAPHVINPASGYVVNANHTPFQSSGPEDNPDPDSYLPHYGIDVRTTNRGLRIQELYGGDPSISEEAFLAYKMDAVYAPGSRLREYIDTILDDPALTEDPSLADALTLLRAWDGSATADNGAAGLAIRIGVLGLGPLLNYAGAEADSPGDALRQAIKEFDGGFGRIDPQWGEVNRLKRGETDLPLSGGPDTLRAIYGAGNPEEGSLTAVGGDSYILYADWSGDDDAVIQTIHQFGSATLDEASPHYDDQAGLFAAQKYRSPPMTLEAVLAQATADYSPGAR